MELQIQSRLLLVFTLLLLQLHFNHARPFHGHDNDHHRLLNMLFFHQKDLKPGSSIPFFFPIRNPNKSPKFLPKSLSDSLPFSIPNLPSILQTLRIDPSSPQAQLMAETLIHCQKPPINGEFKFCATSLESMLDSIAARFGALSSPELLTTSSKAEYYGIQKFKVVEDPKEIEAPNAIACHQMSYPYAVFYCHGQRGSNKIYEFQTETERHGHRIRVPILGMCHLDTSDWDPNHPGFKILGTRPGEEPVCHAFPTDSLIWVPKRSSTLKSLV